MTIFLNYRSTLLEHEKDEIRSFMSGILEMINILKNAK